MTQNNNLIFKSEINGRQTQERVEHNINKKNIKKMQIDREGIHCIIVSDYDLYYNNWNSDQIISINQNLLLLKATLP